MCLRPIHIHNQAKTFNPGSCFSLSVPCGECAECKQMMRDEYYLRSYWQCRYTLDNNGYILFDTLTYDDDHIPHLSDFIPEMKDHPVLNLPCFSYQHVRDFMVDLRQTLRRAGFNPKDNLRYFLTSEYGHQTHRPHYHVLFYVTDNSLSPEALSVAVAKCWKHGRTDGVPYRGRGYVMLHNTFDSGSADPRHVQAVCGYVSKYIMKDSDYMLRLRNRLDIVFNSLADQKVSGSKYWDFTEIRELRDKAYSYVKQFHRQSQHFGEYALRQSDLDSWLQLGMFAVPDKDQVVRYIPMPQYYARKVFCAQRKREDGSRYWELTEFGKRWRYKRTFASVSRVCQRFQDWYRNLDVTFVSPQDIVKLPDNTFVQLSESDCHQMVEDVRNEAKRLLNGRSWLDLANYSVFYKGRVLRSPDAPLDSVADIVSQSLATVNGNGNNVFARVDVSTYDGDKSFVQLVPGDPQEQYYRRFKSCELELVSLPVFKAQFTVTQDKFEQFAGFDDLLDLIDTCNINHARRSEAAFEKTDKVQRLRKILKSS